MMQKYLRLFLLFVWTEGLFAQSVVDCRVVANSAFECNPYGKKFLYAKITTSPQEKLKLIRTKTLPLPTKPTVKVISVEEMIEAHVGIRDSLRYGDTLTKEGARSAIEVLDSEKALGKKIEKLEEDISLLQEKLQKKNIPSVKQTLGTYKVQDNDTLSSISKQFSLKMQDILDLNGLKKNGLITKGQIVKLPVKQAKINAILRQKHTKRLLLQKQNKLDMLEGFGKRTLRVTATAYTSHANQTGGSPFVAAWGTRLHPGMKIIAVSRDMLGKYGMRNGTKVRIAGLPGFYTVRDKMSKRFRKRVDIYMGMDRRAAFRWGRRSVVIHW